MIDRRVVDLRINQLRNGFNADPYPKEFPEWYNTEMARLSEKYKSLRWLPLDIPPVQFNDVQEFIKVWDEHCIDIVRVKPDVAEHWAKEEHPLGKQSNWYKPQFKGLSIYALETEALHDEDSGIWKHKYYQHPVFEPIIQQVKEHFPFHTVGTIFIWESVQDVPIHQDQSYFWSAPSEFRIMLHDENTQPTLYVVDLEHKDINYIDLPADTNSFCWSNGTQAHGSEYLGQRKFLAIVQGIFSISKFENLIDRSIEKYKDQLNYKI